MRRFLRGAMLSITSIPVAICVNDCIVSVARAEPASLGGCGGDSQAL